MKRVVLLMIAVLSFLPVAVAQSPNPDPVAAVLSSEALLWFAAVAAVTVAGSFVVRYGVAFFLARPWAIVAWFTGDRKLLLSAGGAILFTAFMFQPKVLRDPVALNLLPLWETYVAVIVGILFGASGSHDYANAQIRTDAAAVAQANSEAKVAAAAGGSDVAKIAD